MNKLKKIDGFSLIEFVMIFGILGILLSMAFITLQNKKRVKQEAQLRQNLAEVRQSLRNFYIDHHHFPCSQEDFNRQGDVVIFKRQLLWYTNQEGEPAMARSQEFRFGPYLKTFPAEIITGRQDVLIDSVSVQSLVELKKMIAESKASQGGWFYQANNGFFVARLNRFLFKEYFAYF